MTRTQTRTKIYSGRVRRTKYGNTTYQTTSKSVTESVKDVVHSYPYVDEGPLDTYHVKGRPARVSFKRQQGGELVEGTQCPGHFPLVPANQWGYTWDKWLSQAIARSQDSGPTVDLPNLVGELKDLPRTIRSLYKRPRDYVPEDAADVHLTYNFGVSPLVRDIGALMDLQSSIAKRVQAHQQKHETGRGGGKLPQGATFNTPAGLTANGNLSYPWVSNWPFKRTWDTRHKTWYSSRLIPLYDLPTTLSTVAVNPLGLGQTTASAVYNLTPWSFLLDYFSNVGDHIAATQNKVLYTIESICLMCETEVKIVDTPQNHSWPVQTLAKSAGRWTVVEKKRRVYPSPSSQLSLDDFLSGNQIANILALAASLAR